MSEVHDLTQQLLALSPVLGEEDYVFVHAPTASYGDLEELSPSAFVMEAEGATFICRSDRIKNSDLQTAGKFRRISLKVHSSLESVGLTAAISGELANKGICSNMIAGYFHDHIYVAAEKADEAMNVLKELSESVRNS